MYKYFFGLNRSPFDLSPDPSFLCPSAKNKEALASIMYAIANRKGIVVLTGEVGTGKTVIVRSLFELWKRKQIAFANMVAPRLSVIDFLTYAVTDLGIEIQEHSKGDLLRALHRFVVAQFEKGLTTILVIDEAHQIPTNVLEEIRMLTNIETDQQKLVQVLLVGQPELDTKLDAFELRQLKQRVVVRCHLEPFGEKETRDYIERRLELAGATARSKTIFHPEATEAIYSYSRGIPRVINSVCNQALITAYARQVRVVSVEIINEVASYLRLQPAADLRATQPLPRHPAYRVDSIAEMHSQLAAAMNESGAGAVDSNRLLIDVDVARGIFDTAPNNPATPLADTLSDIGGVLQQALHATLHAQNEAENLSARDSQEFGKLEPTSSNSEPQAIVSPGSSIHSTASTAVTVPPERRLSVLIEPQPLATESIPRRFDHSLMDTRPVQIRRWLEPVLRLAVPVSAAVIIIVALTTGVIMARRPNGAMRVPPRPSGARKSLPAGQAVESMQPVEVSSGTGFSIGSVPPPAPGIEDGFSQPMETPAHFTPLRNFVIGALSKPVVQSSYLSNAADLAPVVGPQPKDLELGNGLLDISAPGPTPPGAGAGGHLQPPKVISSPPPDYPSRAHIAKVQGVVVINALVDETGKVADMKLISGSGLLTEAAMNALSIWKYEPAQLNGQPVATRIQVSINFSLH
jgi:general secretion pathway protein A